MSAKTWGLLGFGNIGGELARQVIHTNERLGLKPKPEFILRKTGLKLADGTEPHSIQFLEKLKDFPDVIFVTLPSFEDGSPSYELIKHSLERGALVVTSEKGAMANHFAELRKLSDNFACLGINATVGGGTRVMEASRPYFRDPTNITQLHLALNGTLAAIFSGVGPAAGGGMSIGQAVHQAVMLGYAEPGATDPEAVIRSEAEGDIPKKVSIFLNKSGLLDGGELLDWHKIRFSLSSEEIARAIEEARVRRFIVSVYPTRTGAGPENDIIGGFKVIHEDWQIIGGFRHAERNPLLEPLATLTGPGNGLVVGLGANETDGAYAITGPGAGPEPTVNTMLDDYIRLKK